MYPALTRLADDHPVVGRQVESVAARGKHLLMAFSGDLTLHTHMRMNGSWHIYRVGERWQRPARDMRVVVGTSDFVAVGFNVPVAELLTTRQLARHRDLSAIGPDLLAGDKGTEVPDATPGAVGDVISRMRARNREAIADVLLNQRVVAGIGNVLKSETLFVAGIDPFRSAASLTDDDLARLVVVARDLLRANVMTRAQTLSPAIGRRTTRSLDPSATLWVYGRGGKPCRRCGMRIESSKTGVDARLTYWCPRCQT